MQVKDVMTPNAETVTPGASLADAAKLMRDLNVGMLPVLSGKSLEGVITDRDITIRAGARHWDFEQKTVSDAMSTSVICCTDSDALESAAKLMETHQIRRLAVRDANGDLAGVLSLGDVALRASSAVSGDALRAISQHGQLATATT